MWLDGRRMVAVAADRCTAFDIAIICRRIDPVV
jgi:hypothetical protein